jgi:hypothetical protein
MGVAVGVGVFSGVGVDTRPGVGVEVEVGSEDVLQAGARKRRIRIHHNFFIRRVDSSDERFFGFDFWVSTPNFTPVLMEYRDWRLENGEWRIGFVVYRL